MATIIIIGIFFISVVTVVVSGLIIPIIPVANNNCSINGNNIGNNDNNYYDIDVYVYEA